MKTRTGMVTRMALIVAVAAALIIILAGPAHRFGFAEFGTIFPILKNATIAAGVGVLLGAIGLVIDWRAGRGKGRAIAALLIAGAPFLFMLSLANTGRSVPPIHDISTDTENPPEFVAVLPLRANAPNPPEYAAEFTAQQKAAYPDLKPLEVDMARDAAFTAALDAVKAQGWEIVNSDKAAGLIEATETTTWFGFKDDIVVRVETLGEGRSVIDVRSKSRMGMSDLGANAARIRKLLADIAS